MAEVYSEKTLIFDQQALSPDKVTIRPATRLVLFRAFRRAYCPGELPGRAAGVSCRRPLPYRMLPVYFENAMASLHAHPAGFALLRYRAGKRSLADVQNLLRHTGELLRRRGWQRLLSDQRLLTPLQDDEQALVLDFWQARQFTAGPVTAAVVVAHNAHTRQSIHHVREQARGALLYHLFETEEAALGWLLRQ